MRGCNSSSELTAMPLRTNRYSGAVTFSRYNPPMPYCLQCSYSLRGLKSSKCPECGQQFNRRKRSTYRLRPETTNWVHKFSDVIWGFFLGIPAGIVLVVLCFFLLPTPFVWVAMAIPIFTAVASWFYPKPTHLILDIVALFLFIRSDVTTVSF